MTSRKKVKLKVVVVPMIFQPKEERNIEMMMLWWLGDDHEEGEVESRCLIT